jgi:hypothetical protein
MEICAPASVEADMRTSRTEIASRLTQRTSPMSPDPLNRGRLYYDYQIPDAFFGGLPRIGSKVRWVREHLPRETRVKIGRDSAWYEADILIFLERQRKAMAV